MIQVLQASLRQSLLEHRVVNLLQQNTGVILEISCSCGVWYEHTTNRNLKYLTISRKWVSCCKKAAPNNVRSPFSTLYLQRKKQHTVAGLVNIIVLCAVYWWDSAGFLDKNLCDSFGISSMWNSINMSLQLEWVVYFFSFLSVCLWWLMAGCLYWLLTLGIFVFCQERMIKGLSETKQTVYLLLITKHTATTNTDKFKTTSYLQCGLNKAASSQENPL